MWGNKASDWKTYAIDRSCTGTSTRVAESNQTTSPRTTRPLAGRTRPAMAASVVLLPDPDGPKSTVTPGGASNVTSSAKPSERATRSATWSDGRGPSAGIAGSRRELVDGVENAHRDRREHEDHEERGLVLVLLHGVVDRERRGLRLAGDVARYHEGDAEVAERSREGEHERGGHPARGKGELDRQEGAARSGAQRPRSAHERHVDALEGGPTALHHERHRADGRGEDGAGPREHDRRAG